MSGKHLRVAVGVCAVSVLLAACGGGGEEPAASSSATPVASPSSSTPLLGGGGEPIAVVSDEPIPEDGFAPIETETVIVTSTRAAGVGAEEFLAPVGLAKPGDIIYTSIEVPKGATLEEAQSFSPRIQGQANAAAPITAVVVNLPSGEKCSAEVVQAVPSGDRIVTITAEAEKPAKMGKKTTSGDQICAELTFPSERFYSNAVYSVAFRWSLKGDTHPNDWDYTSFDAVGSPVTVN